MKKIGILFGMENTFPPALVERINALSVENISAEFVKIGAVVDKKVSPYNVIVDRISHEIPFYRSFLKNAALHGSYVINNPFWWSMDDKFIDITIAAKVGVTVPKTIILPSKEHPPNTTAQSMRNLEYPLDWDEAFEYIGFPAFLKPFDGGGWRDVYKIHNPDEFFYYYNQTGTQCMMLQEGIEFTSYYRCYCVGRTSVLIMPYEPRHPMHLRYVVEHSEINRELEEQMTGAVLAINNVLGYDLNTVEFAVRDGVPYAIDFMNPAPDCDYNSVTPKNFEWIVDAMANFCVQCVQEERSLIGPHGSTNFLAGFEQKKKIGRKKSSIK